MTVRGAHLVGSVPLRDSETVFREVSAALGPHLRRLPDGETGIRKDWIAWQYGVLAATPGLAPIPVSERIYLRKQLVERVGPRTPLRFGPLGYAKAALDSFAVFDRLQREGVVPKGLQFQVSLPTPIAPVIVFVDSKDCEEVEPAYEAKLLEELRLILAGVPHDRLAIQWDLAMEIALLEKAWPAHFSDVDAGLAKRLARLSGRVPSDVSMGYHLCYGDFGHRHFTTPRDASTLVRLANVLSAFERRADWMHLPVPIGWAEPTAYAPLAQLALQPSTMLYLGVVHVADGLAGAAKRVALAEGVVSSFGIATECGWGRRPPETVPELLALHAALLGAGS